MNARLILRRSLKVFIEQIRKTIRRPRRIANAPRVVLTLAIHSLGPRLADRMFRAYCRLPLKWRWERVDDIIATANFFEGISLLDDNKPKAAWRAFMRCLAKSSDPYRYFVAAICLLVGMGQAKNALALFTRANGLRREKAKIHGLEKSRIRFLEPIWAGSFGHLAQTDYLIKLSILEGRPPAETIIYLPPGSKVANRYLLEQWRPYCCVVEDEPKLPMPLEVLNSLAFDFLAPQLDDGLTVPLWKIAAETYRRWYSEGNGPLLSIPLDIEKRARSTLGSVGIPGDAWFVALHVREATSNEHHSLLHDSLNADISNYIPAIEEIVRRGGWVIRLGDSTMKSLPSMPGVLDYSHSQIRADWMDIYLLAKCRFLLGTSSGPAHVPPIYGTPSVLTNWWPPAQKPWHPQDIFIPKRIRVGAKRLLTLSQTLEEPFGHCNSINYLKSERNATIQDNSSEDIISAVVEMFDQVNNTAHCAEEDIEVRKRADRIYESFDIHGMARLSLSFLRRNPNFID
jgi:putative glycosyltransferase (TIGR04372 family)